MWKEVKDNEEERVSERASCGLSSDLIKLLPTSYDGHLSEAAVLGRLTPTVTRQGTTLGVNLDVALLVVKQWRQA